MRAALGGVRVVTLAEAFPGPFASLILQELGADVVVVERPGGDPTRSLLGHFEFLYRGKRSIGLDLKRHEAREVLFRLLAGADVVIVGYRPGVARRIGCDHDTARRANPRIAYVSISGFGSSGPDSQTAGHDISYQARAGSLVHPQTGSPAMPIVPLADVLGGLYGAIAALTALFGTRASSEVADISLLECAVIGASIPVVQAANGLPATILPADPGYGLYETGDGRWLALGISREDRMWDAACAVLGLEAAGLGVQRREEDHERLREEIRAAVRRWNGRDLVSTLRAADVAAELSERPGDVPTDRQLAHRGFFVRTDGDIAPVQPRILPFPIEGAGPGTDTWVAPGVGADTREILGTLGYRDDDVESLFRLSAAFETP